MPERPILSSLSEWLASGGRRLGQLSIEPSDRGFELRHSADVARPASELQSHEGPVAAREIARWDDAGKFRPLKTAPNLRHGWRLHVADLAGLREALDALYPAALGTWLRFQEGVAAPVPLRETLGRQSGMYRITALLTDEECGEVVSRTCNSADGCLRRIAWTLDGVRRPPGVAEEEFQLSAPPGHWPLVCPEACHWLVGRARAFIRKKRPAQNEPDPA